MNEPATEVVTDHFTLEEWRIAGIEEALREADPGALGVPHERVAAWVASWGEPDELPAPGAD